MKQKNTPMRKCTGCQQMKTKQELIRIVRDQEGQILPDKTGKQPGRGAYLCRNLDCFALARKKKGLERSFKQSVSAEVYEVLQQEVQRLR